MIANRWKPGDLALVTPSYDGFVYKYYLDWVEQRADISSNLFGADGDAISTMKDVSGNVYLITPQRISPGQTRDFEANGYRQLFSSAPQGRYSKILWMREDKSH